MLDENTGHDLNMTEVYPQKKKVNIGLIIALCLLGGMVFIGVVSAVILSSLGSIIDEARLNSGQVEPDKLFKSFDGKYSIRATDYWKYADKSTDNEASLAIKSRNGKRYLTVIESSKSELPVLSLDQYASLVINGLKQNGVEVDDSGITDSHANGYTSRQFEFTNDIDDLKIRYLGITIDTPQKFYWLSFWTEDKEFDTYRQEFINISSTFELVE
ncbi:MAG: hypothetical protein ACOYWZ_17735 [Bacillota bacterium]